MAIFQIIFKSGINLKSKNDFTKRIKELVIEAVSTQLNEDEISRIFDENFSLNYIKNLSDGKCLVGFNLEIRELEGFIDNLNYNNLFSIDDEIANVFVYKKAEIIIFEEINSIEQRLREVLVYIFVQQYPNNIFDLLKEVEVSTVKDAPKNDEGFTKLAENQFFYLLFTNYIKLSELKKLDEKDLMNYIQNSNTYEELKENLSNRGITDLKYKDFLLSLRDIMQPIEVMRNCIAHNRSIADKIYDDFLNSKASFEHKIQDFWTKEKLLN